MTTMFIKHTNIHLGVVGSTLGHHEKFKENNTEWGTMLYNWKLEALYDSYLITINLMSKPDKDSKR